MSETWDTGNVWLYFNTKTLLEVAPVFIDTEVHDILEIHITLYFCIKYYT